MKKTLFWNLFVVMALFSMTAMAQTVAVPGDFTTIQAAIDNFDPDPDSGTANVIQITDSAVYDEAITIDVPITIEGTGASRPVLTVQDNAGDGIVINIPTGTFNDVTLRNLIVLPSLTSTPVDDAIYSAGQNLNILLEDVLITANDGSNAPVTTDGLTEVDLTSATVHGDDGMFLGSGSTPAGDGTVVTLRNVISSHNNNGAGNDGIVCSGSNAGAYVIEDGCVFSFNGRLGIQANGSMTINATTNRVKVIGNKGFAGIWFAGTGSGTSPVRTVDGVDVIGNLGYGIEQQNGGSLPFSPSNAIVAGNDGPGLQISDVGTDGDTTIQNVTFAGNMQEPLVTLAAHTGNVTITDSIVAGQIPGATPLTNNGSGTIDISFSALVTSGPDRMTPAVLNTGSGAINQTSVINGDPRFIEKVDYQSADYFDVDDPSYGGAGTGGSDLAGGADYIGSYVPPVVTGVEAEKWSDLR